MPDLTDIPGLSELWTHTKGDPRITIAVLDGSVDLERACFQGANLTKVQPYWEEEFPIEPKYLEAYIEIENSDDDDETKASKLKEAIPDEQIRSSLGLAFHATHISSTIFGQPDSPVEGIAPNCKGINIPIAFDNNNFISPLSLTRAINLALDSGANIIHIAACQPTQTGVAHELLDKAIRQAQENNVLIVAPGGNDKGECWCIPAVLENVLTVGAMKDEGEPFKFSNWGGQYQQQGVLAPGGNVLGAQPGTDEAIRKRGTSCAAPIITGISALLMSMQLQQGASPDAEAVRAAITNSAIPCDPQEVEEPERCLLGKLNVSGAFNLLTGETLVSVTAANSAEAMVEASLDATLTDNTPPQTESFSTPSALLEASNTNHTPINSQADNTPLRNESSQSFIQVTEKFTETEFQPTSAINQELQSLTESGLVAAAASIPETSPSSNENAVMPSNTATTITASQTAEVITPSAVSNLVYVLGTLGYDFGTEARRDSFKQLMPAVEIDSTQVPSNPYDARQMVDYLETNLSEASSLIWTLNLELTPVYAIEPVGAFAFDVYETLLQLLAGEIEAEDSESYIERVSIPGRLTDRTVKLFSGQIVPVIEMQAKRGIYGWKINTLVSYAIEAVSAQLEETPDEQLMRKSLSSFLQRVYYDLRNLGQLARDRALNFAATNAFQAASTFSEAVTTGMELDSIEVDKSPFCRLDSDCWDVKLKFFDPENSRRARKIFRFTIDVRDTVPVTLGEVRSWSVPK
ncbi:MAG: PatA/PatG family cyanobactin maturation protease [Merismopedia sp. SIO2A8]|nr:PatA/PatG family cyanobactin maturation protease [Symploca sp. SIO2B6]NET47307.1 PatA/PatG family cyanobactin maturation protease [Merismopedia sp. SIO2A8]